MGHSAGLRGFRGPPGPRRAAGGATPVEVDAFHTEAGYAQDVPRTSCRACHLGQAHAADREPLAQGHRAAWRWPCSFRRNCTRPRCLAPADKPARSRCSCRPYLAGSAQRATGRVVVFAPESLRVNPERLTGLRSVSFIEAFEGIAPGPAPSRVQRPRPGEPQPMLAYAYAAGPVELTLAAERRKPETTVRQLLVAAIEDGVVKYQLTLFYNVRLQRHQVAPARRASGGGSRPARRYGWRARIGHFTPAEGPEPRRRGLESWRRDGVSRRGQIELKWEKKLDKLGVGKSVELPVPYLKPRDVFRSWGQIVLVKSETIEVQPAGEPKSLRMIDPEHDLIAPCRLPPAPSSFTTIGRFRSSPRGTNWRM